MQNIAIKTLKIFVILQLLVLSSSCLDYSRNMVDGKLEPPHPSFWENTFSMKGVDSNNDGIRDDVERWINRKFPGDEKYNLRNLYKQEARVMELTLVKIKNSTKLGPLLDTYAKKADDVFSCASDVYTQPGALIIFKQVASELHSKVFNTPWRYFKKKNFESKMKGKVITLDFSGSKYQRCRFEVKHKDRE